VIQLTTLVEMEQMTKLMKTNDVIVNKIGCERDVSVPHICTEMLPVLVHETHFYSNFIMSETQIEISSFKKQTFTLCILL